MSFIKIGYNEKGEILHTLCNGNPDNPEFFYTDDNGVCRKVDSPMVIEFNQENLKKIKEIFWNDNNLD